VLGVNIRTIQRWKIKGLKDKRKGSIKHVHNKLSDAEEHKIVEIATSDKHKDKTPGEIVAELATEGEYIGSVRSIYRVFKRCNIVSIDKHKKKKKVEPAEVKASRSDELWSWDISWLKSTTRGLYYYLYLFTDIFDRYIVGWAVHTEESGELAKELFEEISRKYNVKGVTLHSDNGGPMKNHTFRATLEKLEVLQSFSRPSVSNDNAYSESLFSTLKRNAGYPKCFKTIEEAKEWISKFVYWYNNEHMHTRLNYITPAQRRGGMYAEIFQRRNETFESARLAHPERWTRNTKLWHIKDEIFLKKGNHRKKAS
jgi:transposase InsO family protein